MNVIQPQTVDDVQACVRGHGGATGRRGPLRVAAGRTKTALVGSGAEASWIDMSALAGIREYQPQECTFTALAGTRIVDIEARLAEHGHYLPFDPPFGPRGSTIGGTVASALSGPARYRYGGIRDFLLGVRVVDGEGRLIRGGGRVVKNAAGFYLHHLVLGSLGRLGVITEVTCKVFPAPLAQATVMADYASFDALLRQVAELRRTAFEIESLEIAPPGRLFVRLGGVRAALAARLEGLSAFLRQAATSVLELGPDDDRDLWRDARELTWAGDLVDGASLVKVATTPGALARLEPRLATIDPRRRYGVGGEVAWIVWESPLAALDAMLSELGLAGMTITGESSPDLTLGPNLGPYLGVRPDAAFLARVTQTFDPRGVFAASPHT
jgi:glycolate oxidase FAD binding subunit